MNIEEKRKIEEMYEKGLVEISSIIEPLIENFKIDRCSIDIQQCQLVIDYLIRDRDFDENYIQQLEEELEKEKEKNKELEEKIIHRYKRICPECNNSFIAKRNNTKYCQKCSKKVARRKYKEANKEKIREYSKLHMRKYRAKKKLLKEE